MFIKSVNKIALNVKVKRDKQLKANLYTEEWQRRDIYNKVG